MRDCSTNLVVLDQVFLDLKSDKCICTIIATVIMQLPEGEGPEEVLSMDQPPVLADQAR